MTRAGLFILTGVVAFLALSSCGDDDGVNSETNAAESTGWWLLEAEGFALLDGGLTSKGVADSTGHLWTLEYANGPITLQVSAWKRNGRLEDLIEEYPTVGAAKVDGYDVTLSRYPGDRSDDSPPAVMADWVDGEHLIGFGGGGLSEEQVRSHLKDLHRVTYSEWKDAVDELPEPPPPPTPTSLSD